MTQQSNTKPANKTPRKTARPPAANVPEPKPEGVESETSAVAVPAKPTSKTAQVLDLLRRPEGATLAQLVECTGWLPHTTRAAMTGLKKKGHAIVREKRDEVSVYSLAS